MKLLTLSPYFLQSLQTSLNLALHIVGMACLAVSLPAQEGADYPIPPEIQSSIQISYGEMREFLSIPNDAHFPEHVQANVRWVQEAFALRGFQSQILSSEGPPLVLARKPSPGAQKTVLIYLQIDGQPVDTSLWNQASPYQPVLKKKEGDTWQEVAWDSLQGNAHADWRVFARSASDAKGPVLMFLAALDVLRKQNQRPNYNIKVIMDFEEELGSPHLPSAVSKYRNELEADMLLIFDGPCHESNQPTLTFGARGIATMSLKVFGPQAPQHSGHFGNYAPNPALRLSQLLAGMKDEQGRVTLPGFYDGIELDAATRKILKQTPDDEDAIRRRLGIAQTDGLAKSYQEAIQYPSLNIRGLSSAWVGDKVRTIVPSFAIAEIDVRLVPESKPERLIQIISKYIQEKDYFILKDREPSLEERLKHDRLISISSTISYQAFRTSYASEVGQWLYRALKTTFGQDPIRIRMSGGSIPISPFVSQLGIPAVTVPTVNRDNNQHSPNENIRLGNYWRGVQTFVGILREKL